MTRLWQARPENLEEAGRRMTAFAARTGLSPGEEARAREPRESHSREERERGSLRQPAPTRYLWTDAFAVCNLLGLWVASGEERPLELSHALVEQVHVVLGHHRSDDRRTGPISGLPADRAHEHPTAGGLRIGKLLPERGPREPFDERLEWERDGQYFHYLTRWMHALDAMGRATGAPRFHRHARELAQAAHAAFTRAAAPGRMVWKMSIALDRPLVPSMGQHDPLDALVTYRQLLASASGGGPGLDAELRDALSMCERADFTTSDPLGIGGLLVDVGRLVQLCPGGDPLVPRLLASAALGLDAWARTREIERHAAHRLAFRELGLAIGLTAFSGVRSHLADRYGAAVDRIDRFVPLGERIVSFWRAPVHEIEASAHRDIDEVMLATCLVPDGYLRIVSRAHEASAVRKGGDHPDAGRGAERA